MNCRNLFAGSILMLFATLGASHAAGQASLRPLAKHANPVNKTLIVETVSPYSVTEYSPAFEIIDLAASDRPDFSHPELTARAYFSALRAKDYEAYLKTWDKRSQILMAERDVKIKFTPEKWRSLWGSVFVGKRIYLTHWITYGKYILLNYKVEPSASAETSQNVAVFALEDGAWKLTQDLRSDQIVTAWKSASGRIRVPGEILLETMK